MRPVSDQATTDAVDDDDLASKLTKRPSDSLEVRAVDARYLRGPEQEATPTRLRIRIVNGVDRDDHAHAAVASHGQRAHLIEPGTHGRRRKHHERRGAARVDLCQEALHAATARDRMS